MDQDYAEVTGGIVYAGSRLIAIRKPEHPAKTEMIELTYIPKQTVDRSRSSAKQRWEERVTANQSSEPDQNAEGDDFDDDAEEQESGAKAKSGEENPEEPSKVKFTSCKLE